MPGSYRSRETNPYTIMFTEVDRFTWSCRMSAMLRLLDSCCQFDASTMPYQFFDDTHVDLPVFFIIIFVPCVLSTSPVIVSYCIFCQSEKCCSNQYVFTVYSACQVCALGFLLPGLYWQASQSGSRIEHAFGADWGASVAAAVPTVLATAFSALALLESMVDFSTWVAPMERR